MGTTGTFAGTSYTVIGFLVRSVTEEGVVYRWQEYLLYNPASASAGSSTATTTGTS